MATVEVRRQVAADAAAVYSLLADVTRMGEWSPESSGARWTSGEPGTVGARFRGHNRNGVFRWSTDCTVTAADPGRRFAFDVTFAGLSIASWEFVLTEHHQGCEVVERAVDTRSRLTKLIGVVATGVRDRDGHNRRTMQQTLDALARTFENAGPSDRW